MNRSIKSKVLAGTISLFLLMPMTAIAAEQLGMKGPVGGGSGTAEYHKLHAKLTSIAKDERRAWAETKWTYVKHRTVVDFWGSNDTTYDERIGYTKTREITGKSWASSHYFNVP